MRSTYALISFLVLSLGCSRYPAGPTRPLFHPSESAEQAIAAYDADNSGGIDEDESLASPGLQDAFSRIDKDGDKVLSAAEIAKRIEYYKTTGTFVINGNVQVTVAGRPLTGAEVTFEPESFLGEHFKPCSGKTGADGGTYIMGFDAVSPGIYLGMYRVRVSKVENGKELIPAKYNTETILGFEATDDIPNLFRGITFDLDRK